MEKLGKKFGSRFMSSNLFAGLPLEAEGGRFIPRLSHAAAVVTPVLQLQCSCPADPQACPDLSQQTCHPMVAKTMHRPVLIRCLAKDNIAKPPHLLQISVWTKPAAKMSLS